MRRRHTLALAAFLAASAPTVAHADGPDVDGGFMDQSVIVICLTKDACPIGGPT